MSKMINKEQAIQIALDYITRGGTQLIDNPPILFEDEKSNFGYLSKFHPKRNTVI